MIKTWIQISKLGACDLREMEERAKTILLVVTGKTYETSFVFVLRWPCLIGPLHEALSKSRALVIIIDAKTATLVNKK